MTVEDVYQLRRQGRAEDAYEACRRLYAIDKSEETTVCMFWTALDILYKRASEQQANEAQKIYLALERVLTRMNDRDGRARSALNQAHQQLRSILTGNRQQSLSAHIQLGRWGEETAADYLRREGYVIMERDWHSKHRDIDLVAIDGVTIVFVEVKTRSNTNFTTPEEAINYRKLRNLQLAINHYLHYHHVDRPWRFDVIAIVGTIGSQPTINHIKDCPLIMR